jgi:hypothetical protein
LHGHAVINSYINDNHAERTQSSAKLEGIKHNLVITASALSEPSDEKAFTFFYYQRASYGFSNVFLKLELILHDSARLLAIPRFINRKPSL